MHIKEEKLKEILLDSGIISEKVFLSAKEEAEREGHSIGEVLIGREELTEEYLNELLQPYFGVAIVDLKKEAIPQEILFLLPESFAKSKGVVLFAHDPQTKVIKLAMVDPLDYETINFVRAKFDAWAEVFFTGHASLAYGLKQYKKKIGTEFNQIIKDSIKETQSLAGETDLSKMAAAVPIITMIDSILDNAAIMGASDVHFEPLSKKLLIRYRIDGVMQEILTLPKEVATILVARVKILASMQIDEHRIPQDGRFKFDLEAGGKIDLRVNVMPVFNGEKVEMRILKGSNKPLSLSELGFSKEASELVTEEIKKPHGMILVTGPTGHGKTTSLYSILHILNTPQVNITTIEDPIEYEVGRINQTQVNAKAGITFANGLRALLRQNPDIIMIGEIRDNETVDIAIHSALTGHLVLSSLHTNDSASAIPRLIDMGAQPFLLASTVNVVIAQRLIRKICLSCIETFKPAARISTMVKEQYALVGKKKGSTINQMFKGKGCKVCGGSGFTGQIGIYEILLINEKIRKMISDSAPADQIRKQAIADGMVTMFEDGMDKVERGITTIEEILRVVRE